MIGWCVECSRPVADEDLLNVEGDEFDNEGRWCPECIEKVVVRYECARCMTNPQTDSSSIEEAVETLHYWTWDGDWHAEFYEDESFGGFCPSCVDYMANA